MPSRSIAFLSHMAVYGGAKGPQLGGNCRQWKSSGLTGHSDTWKNCVNLYKVAFATAASTWIWFWKEEIILPPYRRLHNAYCILWSGHSVPEASCCFSAADKIVPFVSPCSSPTSPLTLPSASLTSQFLWAQLVHEEAFVEDLKETILQVLTSPSSFSPWPLTIAAGCFLQCPNSVWFISLPANLLWEPSHPLHGEIAFPRGHMY